MSIDDSLKRLNKEVSALRQQVDEQGIRLVLASAWVGFLNYAYDALRGYGVDYKTLPEYTQSTAIDEAYEMGLAEGQNKIVKYLGTLKSAVRAAVRRKGFKVH